MASGDIKGFFKEKKKPTAAASKRKSSSTSAAAPGRKKSASLVAGNPPQTPALVAHGSYDLDDDYGEEEAALRRFDMDMRYGPCIGMTRLHRWQRAHSMGLDPPPEIHLLLVARCSSAADTAAGSGTGHKQQTTPPGLECLWDARV